TISAGGGMEYPNVTVIGWSGSDFGLETVIVHEVGHNWFYGILGSNERDNAWMDEGINSFNETRYLLTKYGQQKDLSIMLEGRERLVDRLDLGAFQYKWIDELSYLFPARFGVDQPIQCHSTDLTAMNYGAITYKKAAAAFAMLQSHLGTARFDAAMQSYFDTWKYRHPGPADLQASMEASTGEDLSWFFEDWIQTTKRNDLELRKASTRKGLVVRNRGELASSAKVSGLRGDSVVAVLEVPLMQPGSKVSLAHPDVAGVDRWVLDHERVTLDYDRRNNSRQTRL
ncbi:MAG: M1 family aminopeptidase, partial [Flavobacteriales bacterium]